MNEGRTAVTDRVIVVDEEDRELGTADKLEAHRPPAQLHRAFSVFVCDDAGRVLLQRRAPGKYHFGGLWSNACCSHPRPDEAVLDAARRRLAEEIGLDGVVVRAAGTFRYEATDEASGLMERELDHVVVARTNDRPRLDPAEADAYLWLELPALQRYLDDGELRVTPWFRQALAVATASGWPTRPEQDPQAVHA
ncbi:MAG: isopentenyl-diphosphate Delta-isomerase [Acidimicrobiia bacterium]